MSASTDKIKEYVNELSFSGRFLIVNLKSKDIYFFGDFEVYLVEKSYLVVASSRTSFDKKLPIMGFAFEMEGDMEVLEAEMEGINYFDFKAKEFLMIDNKLKEYKPHPNNTTSTTYNKNSNTKEIAKVQEKTRKDKLENDDDDDPTNKHYKMRTNDSYVKEFLGRLRSEKEKDEYLEEAIHQELLNGEINEFGRTLTEDDLWELWIVPQMEARGELRDIYLRTEEDLKLLVPMYSDGEMGYGD